MAYATSFNGLTQELQDLQEDASADFVAQIPNIIALAELTVVRDLDLEIFKKTLTGTLTASQRSQAKPAGLVKTDSLFITVAGRLVPLEQKSRDYIDFYAPDATAEAVPIYWADLNQANWYLGPTPSDAYAYTARGPVRPDPLSSGNQTNWITDHVGDLLRFAALIECEHFLIDPQRAQEWKLEYSEKLDSALLEMGGQRRNKYTPLRKTPSKSARPEE
ncbi:MAG: hypothetical protein KF895_02935 [Parvibaculum sp.]|nr:hypothetical protein [Parvibaculum sp.]